MKTQETHTPERLITAIDLVSSANARKVRVRIHVDGYPAGELVVYSHHARALVKAIGYQGTIDHYRDGVRTTEDTRP